MKVYLSGPMRGIPEFNFPAFMDAAGKLRAKGHEVFNPAENDLTGYPPEMFACPRGDHAEVVARGFDLRKALGTDLAWICAEAEAIAMLPGWERSKGANAEYAAARAIGLKVMHLDRTGRVVREGDR